MLFDNDITTLECGHQFHTTCINEWLQQRDNCPLCRQGVKNNNVDDAHLIWGVQNERYNNRYSSLVFEDLFIDTAIHLCLSSLDNNIKIKSSNSSNYSIFDFGGGVSGSW